jgi:hypothetical protein
MYSKRITKSTRRTADEREIVKCEEAAVTNFEMLHVHRRGSGCDYGAWPSGKSYQEKTG